jgi:hypothetical protein
MPTPKRDQEIRQIIAAHQSSEGWGTSAQIVDRRNSAYTVRGVRRTFATLTLYNPYRPNTPWPGVTVESTESGVEILTITDEDAFVGAFDWND